MKTIRLCATVFVLCCFQPLFAQEEMSNGMVFPQFEQGTVIFRNGSRSSALLNYNMVQEEMLFKDANGTVLAIANPLDVAVVLIGERRFLPASSKGAFYEEIKTETGSFFVQRKASIVSAGKRSAYGGYSQTTSISTVNSLYSGVSGQVTELTPDEKFNIRTVSSYYLLSGNNFRKFSSARDLGRLFRGQQSKIEEFAREHSINFSIADDVARVVEYGYSLMNG
jgi:hypothetical protein